MLTEVSFNYLSKKIPHISLFQVHNPLRKIYGLSSGSSNKSMGLPKGLGIQSLTEVWDLVKGKNFTIVTQIHRI